MRTDVCKPGRTASPGPGSQTSRLMSVTKSSCCLSPGLWCFPLAVDGYRWPPNSQTLLEPEYHLSFLSSKPFNGFLSPLELTLQGLLWSVNLSSIALSPPATPQPWQSCRPFYYTAGVASSLHTERPHRCLSSAASLEETTLKSPTEISSLLSSRSEHRRPSGHST